MSILNSTQKKYSEYGALEFFSRALGFLYRLIRPLVPGVQPIFFAGIRTCYDGKWSDRFVPIKWLPWWTQRRMGNRIASYEEALLRGVSSHVKSGDTVVIIGGGIGVTAVRAAQLAGPMGSVECYEGSIEQCRLITLTANRNQLGNITVNHAVVAEPIAVYGNQDDLGPIVFPDKLPPCDVLELDCEGAEVQILRKINIRPRVILVETHGMYQTSTQLVRSTMEEIGYVVSDLGWAEPALTDICSENDIRVLVGVNGTS